MSLFAVRIKPWAVYHSAKVGVSLNRVSLALRYRVLNGRHAYPDEYCAWRMAPM